MSRSALGAAGAQGRASLVHANLVQTVLCLALLAQRRILSSVQSLPAFLRVAHIFAFGYRYDGKFA